MSTSDCVCKDCISDLGFTRWPLLHPKLDDTPTKDLVIKSVYAEYCYKGGTKNYKGIDYMRSLIGSYLERLGHNKEMRVQVVQRLIELEPYLISYVSIPIIHIKLRCANRALKTQRGDNEERLSDPGENGKQSNYKRTLFWPTKSANE